MINPKDNTLKRKVTNFYNLDSSNVLQKKVKTDKSEEQNNSDLDLECDENLDSFDSSSNALQEKVKTDKSKEQNNSNLDLECDENLDSMKSNKKEQIEKNSWQSTSNNNESTEIIEQSSNILDLIDDKNTTPDIDEYYHLKTIYTLLYFLNMQIDFNQSEGLFLYNNIFDHILKQIANLDTNILYPKNQQKISDEFATQIALEAIHILEQITPIRKKEKITKEEMREILMSIKNGQYIYNNKIKNTIFSEDEIIFSTNLTSFYDPTIMAFKNINIIDKRYFSQKSVIALINTCYKQLNLAFQTSLFFNTTSFNTLNNCIKKEIKKYLKKFTESNKPNLKNIENYYERIKNKIEHDFLDNSIKDLLEIRKEINSLNQEEIISFKEKVYFNESYNCVLKKCKSITINNTYQKNNF